MRQVKLDVKDRKRLNGFCPMTYTLNPGLHTYKMEFKVGQAF